MKTCSRCGDSKPLSEFKTYLHKGEPRPASRCIACMRLVAKERYLEIKQDPELLAEAKRKNKAYFLASQYGLSPEQYASMLKKSKGRCDICRREPDGRWKTLYVDHCHQTGRVRGLLCYRCNRKLLPLLEEDLNLIQRAIAYLMA